MDGRPPIDSAYGSSEPQTEDPTPEIVPVDRDSEIQGNMGAEDRDKNLALKPSTGEVIDQDTGNVITVVTTTTTTTTTTMAGGKKIDQDVKEDVTTRTQQDGRGRQHPAEMPATQARGGDPNVSESTTSVSASNKQTIPVGGRSYLDDDRPPIVPQRSPNRKSGEYARGDNEYAGQGAGRGQNFSYPSRAGYGGITTADGPRLHNAGTVSSLKDAARGIHVSILTISWTPMFFTNPSCLLYMVLLTVSSRC